MDYVTFSSVVLSIRLKITKWLLCHSYGTVQEVLLVHFFSLIRKRNLLFVHQEIGRTVRVYRANASGLAIGQVGILRGLNGEICKVEFPNRGIVEIHFRDLFFSALDQQIEFEGAGR